MHIADSKGAEMELTTLIKEKKFWRNDRITPEKFESIAESGDILLFRTKHISAKIQRSITGSVYDHVGLLLKYSSGELVLFESTGKTGVGLCRWRYFVRSRWQLLYDKLVYRPLHIERNLDLLHQLEAFIKSAVGKKYSFAPKKLMKKYSKNVDIEKIEDDRTFFCSELVAAAYKKLGLLPKEISAAQYWPGTFSSEKQLSLLNNAKLGNEMLIDFALSEKYAKVLNKKQNPQTANKQA